MKLFNICFGVIILFSGPRTRAYKRGHYPYQDPGLPVEQRVSDLLSRMTDDEKIRQLDMYHGSDVTDMPTHDATTYSEAKTAAAIGQMGIGSIHDLYPVSASIDNQIQHYAMEHTRLHIPVMFIEEGLYGYCAVGSTYFPIPLELASSWDTSLVHAVGHVIASEARSHGVDMILGPVIGLARDPRWGRVEETYGEDPYLAGMNATAMVKGLQGDSLDQEDAVISEPKHFAMHSIPEAGSNTSPVSIGEREARSSFLYVFEKAVRDGGAMGIMAAYSEDDGIPCVDNKWLLTEVLRNEWGFRGMVVSDLGAIKMTIENHHVAADIPDALSRTLKAGLDMQFYDFSHEDFHAAIIESLKQKSLSEDDLNRAVGDVLRVKFVLGLFDHPYTDTSLVSKVFHSPENQDLALRAADEGICLLKNDNGILPLDNNMHSIAVIGPLATSTYLGDYADQGTGISILDALKQRAGKGDEINYAEGYAPDTSSLVQAQLLEKALNLVKRSEVAVVVLGEDASMDGEGKDRADLNLDENQQNLVKSLYNTGKPVVVVLFNGRPLTINWIAEHIPSILETWYSGEKGGLAIADVLLGKINPSGKLPITIPRSVGQLPFYYDFKPTSRHVYVDEKNTPLFPFGLGLSYTSFGYSGLSISPSKISPGDSAVVSVEISNTGKAEGTEVAQLYIRDVLSSVTTPKLALKGFQRITLKPGESGTVYFKIGPGQLSLWNEEMKRVVEPGEFRIMVGSSSADIRQSGSLWVTSN